jgi:hypothetical protein
MDRIKSSQLWNSSSALTQEVATYANTFCLIGNTANMAINYLTSSLYTATQCQSVWGEISMARKMNNHSFTFYAASFSFQHTLLLDTDNVNQNHTHQGICHLGQPADGQKYYVFHARPLRTSLQLPLTKAGVSRRFIRRGLDWTDARNTRLPAPISHLRNNVGAF